MSLKANYSINTKTLVYMFTANIGNNIIDVNGEFLLSELDNISKDWGLNLTIKSEEKMGVDTYIKIVTPLNKLTPADALEVFFEITTLIEKLCENI